MNACDNPGFLKAMIIVNSSINIIKILVPVLIILTGMVSFFKSLMDNDADSYKKSVRLLIEKFIIGAFIYFIPLVVSSFIGLVDSSKGYESCFNNASEEKIAELYKKIALEKVEAAEISYNSRDVHKALAVLSDLDDETLKKNLTKRLDVITKEIERKQKESEEKEQKKREDIGKELEEDNTHLYGSGELSASGSTSSGNGACQKGIYQNSEPDPSAPINCWPNIVSADNFIYPKDEKTGLPLGAWPKNYASYPTQLSGYKTYYGEFIFPTTPTKETYHFVYDHNGIDIMSNFGTPVYSPVDGKLDYSEWGHTSNRGGDETSYSISITLSKPTTVGNTTITSIFLTHMSGIRYRCTWNSCNRNVKKGELIGFTGNAAGTSESVGWAPHLHATYYPASGYDAGLRTANMESLYSIPNGTSSYHIVAGG